MWVEEGVKRARTLKAIEVKFGTATQPEDRFLAAPLKVAIFHEFRAACIFFKEFWRFPIVGSLGRFRFFFSFGWFQVLILSSSSLYVCGTRFFLLIADSSDVPVCEFRRFRFLRVSGVFLRALSSFFLRVSGAVSTLPGAAGFDFCEFREYSLFLTVVGGYHFCDFWTVLIFCEVQTVSIFFYKFQVALFFCEFRRVSIFANFGWFRLFANFWRFVFFCQFGRFIFFFLLVLGVFLRLRISGCG